MNTCYNTYRLHRLALLYTSLSRWSYNVITLVHPVISIICSFTLIVTTWTIVFAVHVMYLLTSSAYISELCGHIHLLFTDLHY